MRRTERAGLPAVAPWLLSWFRRYAGRYASRHFTALRLARGGADPAALAGWPLVVCANHPSWWDPLICLLLAARLFPGRQAYAPIDAAALERYRFFARLGFFGLDRTSPRGAVRFLQTSQAILSSPERALWITAQGAFTDARARPAILAPGLGHLVRHLPRVACLPLALEYTFWDQRLPEALALVGEPLFVEEGRRESAAAWTERLARGLEEAQDRLAAAARSRQPERFTTLLQGRVGVGWIYDGWRRLRAALAGRPFSPAHPGGRR